jgi:hypothetical protein
MAKKLHDQFLADVLGHEMQILKDDGLYRHLFVKNPHESTYWYEVITTPRMLTINGDMGTYTFSAYGREDMFVFFRNNPGYVNEQYWTEKLVAYGNEPLQYSQDNFSDTIIGELRENMEWEGEKLSYDEAKVILEPVLQYAYSEDDARDRLDDFEYKSFSFSATWEYDFRDYRHNYLWCLHAIVWAIHKYDKAKKTDVEPEAA